MPLRFARSAEPPDADERAVHPAAGIAVDDGDDDVEARGRCGRRKASRRRRRLQGRAGATPCGEHRKGDDPEPDDQASPGSLATGSGRLFGERFEGTVGTGGQTQVREEAGHGHALAEISQARLGPFTPRQREGELGVAPAGRERQREAAAEAWVDVGDLVAILGDPEALDVGRAPDRQGLRHQAAELDQLLVLDRRPLDRLAALRLDHRPGDRAEAAALEVAEDVDRELLTDTDLLHERLGRRATKVEVELLAIRGPIDVARAEAAPGLDEHRERELVRQLTG